MKFKALLLLACTVSGGSAIAGEEERQRDAYFQALTAMSPELAAYSFALEQYLDAKCGRPQSLAHIQAVLGRDDANALPVILALKAGNADKAKATIQRLPCEQ